MIRARIFNNLEKKPYTKKKKNKKNMIQTYELINLIHISENFSKIESKRIRVTYT